MGASLPEVVAILTRARDLLLRESQQAGGQGDWGSVKTLIDLAERADRLREEIPLQIAAGVPGSKDAPEPSPGLEERGVIHQPPGPATYPKYLVRGRALIKQGLQRNGYDLYEHAVPQERYEDIVHRLVQMLPPLPRPKHPRSFAIEQVQQGLNCPRYMTYVVVSMLVRERVLIRARKGSYTFAAPATFAADAATLWERLKAEEVA